MSYKGRFQKYGFGIRVLETDEIFLSRVECANALGISPQSVSDCISGRVTSCRGYHLEVVDVVYDVDSYLENLREQSYENGEDREWRAHPYFYDLILSDDGIAISCCSGKWRELTPTLNRRGYLTVYVRGKNRALHRLLAETFIPNPDDKPHINHIDGDKTNNHIYNLEWCTASENEYHAYRTGLKKPHHKGRKIIVVETGEVYDSIAECARTIDGKGSSISRCLANERNTHRGYHYEYMDEDDEGVYECE